jgi:diacylglycerol O-acyltransferase / wax synthase
MSKIHHAVVDGLSGAEILGALLDLTPEERGAPPELTGPGDRKPGDLEMLARGLLGVPRYPLRLLRSVPRALPNIDEVPQLSGIPGLKVAGQVAKTAQRVLGGGQGVVGHSELVPPRTSFNGRVSPHRRFASSRSTRSRRSRTTTGVTVNDVVVSLCAGTVRRWLVEHHELPAAPLVAQIPVSVRTEEEYGTYGNRILIMSAPLFTNEADPVARLALTHEALAEMKERHRALPAQLLQDANQFVPPAVFSRAARLTFRLAASQRGRPAWNLVVSNVPGPQFPLYLAGARLEANYPVSVVTDGLGLNITVMSYPGHLDFGIVADHEQTADPVVADRLPARGARGARAAAGGRGQGVPEDRRQTGGEQQEDDDRPRIAPASLRALVGSDARPLLRGSAAVEAARSAGTRRCR